MFGVLDQNVNIPRQPFFGTGSPVAPVTERSTVAVLGAGHGGLALAGYLSQHGHRVALWNRSRSVVFA
jgi:NADPH-dependent glutamate synthase beta subunit-like oxidoreductase